MLPGVVWPMGVRRESRVQTVAPRRERESQRRRKRRRRRRRSRDGGGKVLIEPVSCRRRASEGSVPVCPTLRPHAPSHCHSASEREGREEGREEGGRGE